MAIQDHELVEAAKVEDYMNRWEAYEHDWNNQDQSEDSSWPT